MFEIIRLPFLLEGKVMHSRMLPKKNYFNYKSTYISFPIKKISNFQAKFFGIQKWNLYSFFAKNYTFKKLENIQNWICDILHSYNIKNVESVVLVTHPAILGYVFNPVSFWLCFNEENQLVAVLSEVNNRSKQRHHYLCFNEDFSAIQNNQWLVAKKVFHVSPFFQVEGEYKFCFQIDGEKMHFIINYYVDEKLHLTTSLKCKLLKFTNTNLLIAFLKIPFATFKTTFLIHYQALKLFIKGIKFYNCPPKNNINITKNYDKK